MRRTTRRLWQFPWKLQESLIVIAGIIVVGFALQLAAGPVALPQLRAPGNLFAAAVLLVLIFWGKYRRESALVQWLSGIPMAVCLIAAFLLFSLVMGLTPQEAQVGRRASGLIAALGFTRVTASWPFVLIYILTLISLGLVVARRPFPRRIKDLAFYCNHLGLWILLLAAGFGATDMRRFIMHVPEGATEWRVYNAEGGALELPVAITLHDFAMEEFPPKLVVIHSRNGLPQPEGRAEFFPLNAVPAKGRLLNWEISLEKYIHQAVRAGDAYKESAMPASTPAALVTIRNFFTGESKSAWICGGGNIPELFSGLDLDKNFMLVMTRPEPKRFSSDITVLTQNGSKQKGILEVNAPLRVGLWQIYQYGYDAAAGKMSSYSSMELIYDPWLYPAYAGMVLLLLGALFLVFSGTGKIRP
jgi:hypothetical protein